MRNIGLTAIAELLMLASCNGTNNRAGDAPELQGVWAIEEMVADDSLHLHPTEIAPDRQQCFTFAADGSFGINTNCNMIGGEYALYGDSIVFTSINTTEMACDNMEVEQMLWRILPEIRTVECVGDSMIRLNGTPASHILLSKVPSQMK